MVSTGGDLTIAPGAEIQFVPGDNMRGHRDPERIEIVVHGTLVVGDSEGAPVTLSASAANAQRPNTMLGTVFGWSQALR